ncbi:MAG: hypothetical protein J0J01_20900 [Reyranella sp.]|uniref:hypothetical protein n=1 Tax=Reyranella sp. TaxID=1929291 RepID=UPI001AD4FCC8|nr:hypothetical protein [Reyranella sp.]MBN9089375.1 hypothetical protein [Reyranella sp.]
MSDRKRDAFELPDTIDLDSVNAAQVALIRLVAQNQLDAREALYISRMLEHRRRAIGTATLWQKMKELEAQGRQMRDEAP